MNVSVKDLSLALALTSCVQPFTASGQEVDPTPGAAPTRQLILMFGQSTDIGRGNVNTLVATAVPAWTATFPAVKQIQFEGTHVDPPVQVYDDTRVLQPRTWNDAGVNMGPELSMGRYLTAVSPVFDIVKWGVGGCGLQEGFTPSSTYPSTGGNALARTIAYARLAEIDDNARVVGAIFHGLETDSLTSGPAGNTQANLTAMLAALRAVWPGLPLVVAQLTSQLPIGTYVFRDTVRAGILAFAAASTRVTVVNNDDMAIDSGSHEYVGDSLLTMGVRDAIGMLGLLGIDILPVANWSVQTNGLTATFTDSSTDVDGTIVSRSWTFGDGGTSTASNPVHVYATGGTYSVTETTTDNVGGQNAFTNNVTVAAPTWYVDAGSGFGMPKSPADWAAAIAALANGTPVPTHAWLFDLASGNVTEMLGTGKTLIVSGAPLYHQTIAPWTALGMGPNGTAVNQVLTNAAMLNVNANPSWLFGYIGANVTAQNRQQMFHGGADNNSFEAQATTAKARYRIGAAAKNSTLDHYDGSIRPIHLVYNPGVEASYYSQIEKMQLTSQPITAASGVSISVQLGISTDAASSVRILMLAHWDGFVPTNAQVKAMNQLFSWPVSGY